MEWGLQPPNGQRRVHHSRNGVRDKKQKEALHVNIHLLRFITRALFACVINLLITEQINTITNVWTDITLSPFPEITNSKIIPFLAFPVQMGHNTWTRMEHFFPHFYPSTMIKDSSHASHVTFIPQTIINKLATMMKIFYCGKTEETFNITNVT